MAARDALRSIRSEGKVFLLGNISSSVEYFQSKRIRPAQKKQEEGAGQQEAVKQENGMKEEATDNDVKEEARDNGAKEEMRDSGM